MRISDWSSDGCSSDLPATREPIARLAPLIENVPSSRLFDEILKLLTCGHAMDCLRQLQSVGLHQGLLPLIDLIFEEDGGEQFVELALARTDARVRAEIGRASCRESVCQYV